MPLSPSYHVNRTTPIRSTWKNIYSISIETVRSRLEWMHYHQCLTQLQTKVDHHLPSIVMRGVVGAVVAAVAAAVTGTVTDVYSLQYFYEHFGDGLESKRLLVLPSYHPPRSRAIPPSSTIFESSVTRIALWQ